MGTCSSMENVDQFSVILENVEKLGNRDIDVQAYADNVHAAGLAVQRAAETVDKFSKRAVRKMDKLSTREIDVQHLDQNIHAVGWAAQKAVDHIEKLANQEVNHAAIDEYLKDMFLSEDVAGIKVHGMREGKGSRLTREEQQGISRLAADKIPFRSLSESNFLSFYKKCPRAPTREQVMENMSKGLKDAMALELEASKSRANHGDNNVSAAAARLWTSNHVYRAVNAALISDNAGLLQHWCMFIRALNAHILQHNPKHEVITRRLSHMTRDQAKVLEVGKRFRLCNYVATSACSWDAMPAGVGGKEVRIEFVIPANCKQAADLRKVSWFPNENEVLLVPYSVVDVNGVDVDAATGVTTIRVKVLLDSKALPDDLPSAVA